MRWTAEAPKEYGPHRRDDQQHTGIWSCVKRYQQINLSGYCHSPGSTPCSKKNNPHKRDGYAAWAFFIGHNGLNYKVRNKCGKNAGEDSGVLKASAGVRPFGDA